MIKSSPGNLCRKDLKPIYYRYMKIGPRTGMPGISVILDGNGI